MTSAAPVSASRRRPRAFGSRGGSAFPRPAPWAVAGLALVPVLLTLAHLMFGANQAAASAWLTAAIGLALLAGLATPLRRELASLRGLTVPALLFAAVLAAALLSLTPWGPGGPHPVWAWAGVEPGALTIDRSATQLEIVKHLGLACVFGLGALQAARRGAGQTAVELVVWVGAAYAAISLLTFLSGLQIAPGRRLTGGFLSANSGGTLFGVLIVLSLSVLLRDWRRSEGRDLSSRLTATAMPIAALVLAAACLLLTASRMALVATLIATSALLIWSLAGRRRGRGAVAVGAALLIVVAGVLVWGGNDLLWARLGQEDPGLSGRAELFAVHWQAFLASPLTGWGLGSFDAVNLQMMTAETAPQLWTIRATHNVYLQWLEEAGLIGAAPMFLLIAWLLVDAAWRARRGGPGQTILIGLVCANLVVLLHGLTDFALQVPSIAAFWSLLLGFQFGFGRGGA